MSSQDPTIDLQNPVAEVSADIEPLDDSSPGLSAFSDAWITMAVRLRLLSESELPTAAVRVDTASGVVMLLGTVPSREAKRQAEDVARRVSGVRAVRNHLRIAAPERPREGSDEAIRSRLEEALGKQDGLREVRAEVREGAVVLRGNVISQLDRLSAAVIARAADRVRSVRNEIEVRPEPGRGEGRIGRCSGQFS